MTINFSTGEEPPDAVLAETEGWLDEAAQSIALTLRAIRLGEFGQIKDAKAHVQNLRAALDLYIGERNRVEKLRKQVAGAVGASGRLCCTNRVTDRVPLSPDRLIPRLP